LLPSACDNDSAINESTGMIIGLHYYEIPTKTNEYDVIATIRDMLQELPI
jgi:hypothetical protein